VLLVVLLERVVLEVGDVLLEHPDLDSVGDLDDRNVVVDPADAAEQAAGQDDAITPLELGEPLLALVLLLLHRPQHEEVEDSDHQDEDGQRAPEGISGGAFGEQQRGWVEHDRTAVEREYPRSRRPSDGHTQTRTRAGSDSSGTRDRQWPAEPPTSLRKEA